jgi:cell division transport system ATP-binding protein
MIYLEGVSVVYDNGVRALDDVTLHVDKGEFVFIVGPTGHGKSTLLKLLYREERPSAGAVRVAGRDVVHLPAGKIPHLRRRIGIVFQDFRLLPQRTVWENVAFALRVTGASRREVYRRLPELLSQIGLFEKHNAFPSQLSAGEQQRVAIARALANHPPLLLADEPTGNLDPATSRDILHLLEAINRDGSTVVMATHDQELVNSCRKRVISLHEGRIASDEREGRYYRDVEPPVAGGSE